MERLYRYILLPIFTANNAVVVILYMTFMTVIAVQEAIARPPATFPVSCTAMYSETNPIAYLKRLCLHSASVPLLLNSH